MTSVEVRSMRKSAALRPRGPGKLQAARSLPVDRYSAAVNGVRRRTPAGAEEEVVGPEGDEDSPYSPKAATAAEEEVGNGSGGGDEVESATAATATPKRVSPPGAASPSQGDSRWGDTTSYGAKKVEPPLLF
jgi:myosin V